MLKNRVILITGSSKPNGIGFATAKLAKEYGAKVILHGRTDDERLRKNVKELGAEYITCDVTDKNAVAAAVNQIFPRVGKIDALVNCVGIVKNESFLETSDEDWIDIFKVNVLGTVHFCQAAIPHMQKLKYGRIVNISSIRGHESTASPTRPAYSASKGAIISLTSSLAKAYAPDILVNAVSPGFTMTDMSKEWTETGWIQAKSNLLGRPAEPKEIAEAILFLAGDRNTHITGQTILVDGGYSISGK